MGTVKAGYLNKLSGFFKNPWKKRYFVLYQDGVFCYYQDANYKESDGKIHMKTECRQIKVGNAVGEGVKPPKDSDVTAMFCVSSPERTWYLYAESESEAREWISVLDQARVPLSYGGPHHPPGGSAYPSYGAPAGYAPSAAAPYGPPPSGPTGGAYPPPIGFNPSVVQGAAADLDQLKQSLILELENGTVESWKQLLFFMGQNVDMTGIVALLFLWYEIRGGSFSHDKLEHLSRSLIKPRMQQSEVDNQVSSVPKKIPSEGCWPISNDNLSKSSSVQGQHNVNTNLHSQWQAATQKHMGQHNVNTNLHSQWQLAVTQRLMHLDSENTSLKHQVQVAGQLRMDQETEIASLQSQLEKAEQVRMEADSKNLKIEAELIRRSHTEKDLRNQIDKLFGSFIIKRKEVANTKKLGEGAYGVVYKGIVFGAEVAVKELKDNSPENRTRFLKEIELAVCCHHPNVAQIYGVIPEGKLSIVMELLDLTLKDFIINSDINRLDKHFKNLALGMAKALLYFQSKMPPLIHRDLHPGNVLLKKVGHDEYEVKIVDLGSANTLSERMTPGRGTPIYAAPENMTSDQQTPKMDVYSFGVILYILATRRDPKTSTSLREEVTCRYKRQLIYACIRKDPKKRPELGQIIKFLGENF